MEVALVQAVIQGRGNGGPSADMFVHRYNIVFKSMFGGWKEQSWASSAKNMVDRGKGRDDTTERGWWKV